MLPIARQLIVKQSNFLFKSEYRLLLIETGYVSEVGDAGSETLRKFWDKITKTNEVQMVCADENQSYVEVFGEDSDLKHVVTKSETC
ncbi:MAG: hypothetical protein LBG04_02465 [Holosporaceae bacterium]|jgi:IS1 family transposase|nr:hypothetical protein [Holosporaceae bacterium]